jgi:hypothetical protein
MNGEQNYRKLKLQNSAKSLQKQPHFHEKIHTTNLQPETPLSANSSKMLAP